MLRRAYLDVAKPYCRGCHLARTTPNFDDPASFLLLGTHRACDGGASNPFRHDMPHAEATMVRFWSSSARATLVNTFGFLGGGPITCDP
jgi:hypothetical protein